MSSSQSLLKIKLANHSVSAWQMKLFHRWLFWLAFLSILGLSFLICKMKIIMPHAQD